MSSKEYSSALPAAALADLIARFKDARVLVVGDVMLDRYVYGDVERISPESPVPVLAIRRENTMLGGAGNALANLAGLGAHGYLLSLIGTDAEGQTLKKLVRELGFSDTGLLADDSRPTIVKTRFLAGHQQLLRVDHERPFTLSNAMQQSYLQHAERILEDPASRPGAVLISDYGKGLLTQAVLKTLIEKAAQHGIPVIVDPKGQDFSIYRGAAAVTPNRKELSEATRGRSVKSDSEITDAAQEIIESCGIGAVIATRSAEGMSVISAGQAPFHIKSRRDIEVFDVSGAGDTVIATMAASRALGCDWNNAAVLANLAGSIVVTKVGTAPIRARELLLALDSGETEDPALALSSPAECMRQAPLLGWDEAAEQVRRWRARGLKVGFTNGCFDVLHKGHVGYLNAAREQCDRLVVGLNSDTSVRLLKGPERPVHDEASRAVVLGALGSVDLVCLFGAQEAGQDNTASDLISLLAPALYFKGGDYSVDEIPEAPAVRSGGGEIMIMPVFEGHSSTRSIQKMKAV